MVVAAVLVLALAATAAYLIIHHKPKAPTSAPATTSVNELIVYSSPNFVMYGRPERRVYLYLCLSMM